MKKILLPFIILSVLCTIFTREFDKETQIRCLKGILINNVQPLGKKQEIRKEELLKKLKDMKSELFRCQISEGTSKRAIIEYLDKKMAEVNTFSAKWNLKGKSREYSQWLSEKFQELDQDISNSTAEPGGGGDSAETSSPAGQTGASTQETQQELHSQTASKLKKPVGTPGTRGTESLPLPLNSVTVLFIVGILVLFMGTWILLGLLGAKKMSRRIDALSGNITTGFNILRKELEELETYLRNADSKNLEKLNGRLLETDDNVEHEVNKVIELIKVNDREILNRLAMLIRGTQSLAANTGSEREDSKDQRIFRAQPPQEPAPPQREIEPTVSVTGYPFRQEWKNEIFSTAVERKAQIKAFDTTLVNFNVTTWVEEILKKFNEQSLHDEIAFFKDVLPRIKTLKEALTERQYNMFKTIFLDDFLESLGIEEFGREGDVYDFNRHEVVGRIGERGNDIQKVIMPGYKVKLSPNIISKASVKL